MTGVASLKRELSRTEITAVLAPLGRVVDIAYLTGGLFASVAKATLEGGAVVAVKSSPPVDAATILTYEQGVMTAEAEVLRLAEDMPRLRLPRLRLHDTSHARVEIDILVTDFLPGRRWDECEAEMSATANATATAELGAVLSAFASVRGERFGYVSERAPEFSANQWATTFDLMVESLLTDAARYAVRLPARAIRNRLARHRRALEAVREPRLVHGDLWAGNTFVDPATGRVTGVIDAERALWGDPLFDIAGTDQLSSEAPPPALLIAAGMPGRLLPDAWARLNLYRLWFAVAMLAEAGPRGHLFENAGHRQADLEQQLNRLLVILAD